jgi:hypothetical protein
VTLISVRISAHSLAQIYFAKYQTASLNCASGLLLGAKAAPLALSAQSPSPRLYRNRAGEGQAKGGSA